MVIWSHNQEFDKFWPSCVSIIKPNSKWLLRTFASFAYVESQMLAYLLTYAECCFGTGQAFQSFRFCIIVLIFSAFSPMNSFMCPKLRNFAKQGPHDLPWWCGTRSGLQSWPIPGPLYTWQHTWYKFVQSCSNHQNVFFYLCSTVLIPRPLICIMKCNRKDSRVMC